MQEGITHALNAADLDAAQALTLRMDQSAAIYEAALQGAMQLMGGSAMDPDDVRKAFDPTTGASGRPMPSFFDQTKMRIRNANQ